MAGGLAEKGWSFAPLDAAFEAFATTPEYRKVAAKEPQVARSRTAEGELPPVEQLVEPVLLQVELGERPESNRPLSRLPPPDVWE